MRRPPVAGHRLATVEAPIFFRGPIALIPPRLIIAFGAIRSKHLPGLLDGGAGLVERVGGAAALLAGIAARIEPAQPLPGLGRARIADALGNRADVNVAVIDVQQSGRSG